MKGVQVNFRSFVICYLTVNWLAGVGVGGVFDFPIEESLPPSLISHRRTPAEDGTYNRRSSLLAEQLQEYKLAKEGGYLGLQDYANFAEVDLST